MKTYKVIKPFEEHQKDDTIELNARQAMHLELAGFIKATKKPKAKAGGAA